MKIYSYQTIYHWSASTQIWFKVYFLQYFNICYFHIMFSEKSQNTEHSDKLKNNRVFNIK